MVSSNNRRGKIFEEDMSTPGNSSAESVMLSAIVLAAGMSTRMGQNKLLLDFKDKPLIAHAVDTLLASEIDEVIVVLGNEAEQVQEKLRGRQVRLVENPDFREALSTSVRAGVNAVSRQADGIMVYL